MFSVDQELPPSQIIMNDPHAKAFGAEKVVKGMKQLVDSGKAILLQHNNTVVLAIQIGNGEVEIHIYTIDPPHRLASALKYFHDEFLKSGIQKVYATEMPDKQLIKLMLAVGIPVEKSDKPNYYVMGVVS